MLIFSQFGEIVWQRLFNIVRIMQTTALKNLLLETICQTQISLGE